MRRTVILVAAGAVIPILIIVGFMSRAQVSHSPARARLSSFVFKIDGKVSNNNQTLDVVDSLPGYPAGTVLAGPMTVENQRVVVCVQTVGLAGYLPRERKAGCFIKATSPDLGTLPVHRDVAVTPDTIFELSERQ